MQYCYNSSGVITVLHQAININSSWLDTISLVSQGYKRNRVIYDANMGH